MLGCKLNSQLIENTVEDAALSWFSNLGYSVLHSPDIAPGEPNAERDSFSDVVLVGRLRDAINRLNPKTPPDARDEALRKVLRLRVKDLDANAVLASVEGVES